MPKLLVLDVVYYYIFDKEELLEPREINLRYLLSFQFCLSPIVYINQVFELYPPQELSGGVGRGVCQEEPSTIWTAQVANHRPLVGVEAIFFGIVISPVYQWGTTQADHCHSSGSPSISLSILASVSA